MSKLSAQRCAALLTLAFSLTACSTLPTPHASTLPQDAQGSAPQLSSGFTRISAMGLAASSTLVVGQSKTFTVYVGGKAPTPGQLIWTTSNAGLVSVTQGGTVQALSPGNATVRAALSASPSAFIDFPVTVTAANAPASTPTTSAYAQRVLDLTNAARAVSRTCGSVSAPAVPTLSLSSQLTAASQGHARDMTNLNYFSHTSQDGRTFDQRISAAGYTWSAVGENIAAGQPTPEAVVAGSLHQHHERPLYPDGPGLRGGRQLRLVLGAGFRQAALRRPG